MRESAEYRTSGPKGLKSIVAERRKPQVTMVGHRYDPSCVELRRFLTRNQITLEGVDVEDADLQARWEGPVPPEADLPTMRLADGTVLVKPQPRVLAEKLGLQTRPNLKLYDTVIIGGGPAGLAAAVYGASEGLRTVVIEREAPGGQAGTSSRIENYLGFPNGISGDELALRALRQAKRLGAEILVTRAIDSIDTDQRAIDLDGGDEIWARTVIIATGVSWRRLAIDGFDRLIGKGIYYGAARSEAGATQGMDVHLIGAGNSAGQAAMFFANHARTVTLIVRGDSLEKSMSQYLVNQVRSKPNIKVALQLRGQGPARRRPPDRDRHPRSRRRRGAARGVRWALRLHRRRRRDRLAAAGDRPRPARLCADRHRPDEDRALAGRARPVSPRDQRAGRLRLRRRALLAGQARRCRRGRGEHGDRLRPPVSEGGGGRARLIARLLSLGLACCNHTEDSARNRRGEAAWGVQISKEARDGYCHEPADSGANVALFFDDQYLVN